MAHYLFFLCRGQDWQPEIPALLLLGACMAYSWQVACIPTAFKIRVCTVYACIRYIKLFGGHWPQTNQVKEKDGCQTDQSTTRKFQRNFRNEERVRLKISIKAAWQFLTAAEIFEWKQQESKPTRSCPAVISTFAQQDGSATALDAVSSIQLASGLWGVTSRDLHLTHAYAASWWAFSPAWWSVGYREWQVFILNV